MSKLMLIDATHPEETRVAVVANGQIEDFDFEARNKRQLRGNIYLAKVTRVEPSLQAAFVDYGGNRHGFLAFSEIHPDYYQIPKEDREALLAEADEAEDEDSDGEDEDAEEENERKQNRRNAFFQRKYKIQEVIRRRQVMLVQVVKEERGNKGAALTTYLSLAGRYCVLMPNTSRGGGISRKITNANDRRRLKAITSEFEIPRGAGLIVRTAGGKRTKNEIRRDFEYLTKLWQQIVGKTMESMAPALIHEEGHLVLRAVRDLYDKDVERIIVEGEDAYNEARTFVKMLMPSHTRKVVLHDDNGPLFVSTGIEDQLESIFSPTVQLPSGGYIVINQTEALVAIDVNSGKATRERNVEATALKTNMEAAAEACRQMRLRDLAGLIVIDFIDMEDNKNNRSVEKRMKDSLKIDRARVQTGRISQFGLFEISRQRRRAGVLELSSEVCDHCGGTGRVRSIESAAIQLLRTIEARAADDRVEAVHVVAAADVALYLLNEKRSSIANIEADNHVAVRIEADEDLKIGEFTIEGRAGGEVVAHKPMQPIDLARLKPLPPPADDEIEEEDEEIIEDSDENDDENDDRDDRDNDRDNEDEPENETSSSSDSDEDRGNRGRRGRRGGRNRGRGRDRGESSGAEVSSNTNREDRGGRGRSRKRRGGRDRDRNRTPDIAADGGEMLDAIASAPFLTVAPPAPEMEDSDEHFSEGSQNQQSLDPPALSPPSEPMSAVPVFEAPPESEQSQSELESEPRRPSAPSRGGSRRQSRSEPSPEPAQSRYEPSQPEPSPYERQPESPQQSEQNQPQRQDHEIAASAVEAQSTTSVAEDASVAAQQAETRRHPIHGAPEEPAPEPAAAPRKMGWWSRRKTG